MIIKDLTPLFARDPIVRTLADVWLSADEFYRILEEWRDTFEAEWVATPKAADPYVEAQ